MQLDGAYEFFELNQLDGIFVSRVREKATGRPAQCHVFPADRTAEASQIAQRVLGLPEDARAKIIKFGQDGGMSYFITEPLPGGASIKNWIASLSNTAAPSPAPEGGAGLGEFTRFYTEMEVGAARASAPPAPAPQPPPLPQSKPAGEFTRMYTAEDMRKLRSDVTANYPQPAPADPAPAPETSMSSAAPGLETYLGIKPPTAQPKPFTPPPPARVIERPFPRPAPPPPVAAPPPIAAPPPVAAPDPWGTQDLFAGAPAQPFSPPPAAPARSVLPPPRHVPHTAPPRPPARSNFDGKMTAMVVVGLLAIAALVIVIVG